MPKIVGRHSVRSPSEAFGWLFNESGLTEIDACWLPLASFIKLDLTKIPLSALSSLIQLAKNKSSVQLIAEKIKTAEQDELTTKLGI